MPGRACRVVLAALLGLAGCGPRYTVESLRTKLADIRANCVVVVLDAASAGHMGGFGYARDTTPHIDRLAQTGVGFEHVFSPGVSTIVSVPSMFAGRYPQSIVRDAPAASKGVMRALPQALLQAEPGRPVVRLAHAFAGAGFRTAAFSENPVVSPRFGVLVGFTDVVEDGETGQERDGSAALVQNLLGWLARDSEGRSFAYLHLLRPHSPYLPPARFANAFRPPSYTGTFRADTMTLMDVDFGRRSATPADVAFLASQYDANLAYADTLVEDLMQGLRAAKLDERTVVVVTADHGEAFGEHGRFMHNTTVYQEMVHVPLVLSFPPELRMRRTRVTAPATLVDVLPTLGSLFGLAGTDGGDGIDLTPLMLGESGPARPVFMQALTRVAVVAENHKYIHDAAASAESEDELYDLVADPGERTNIRATDPARTAALRVVSRKFVGDDVADLGLEHAAAGLPADVVDRLRAIGYLGGPETHP